MTQINNGNPFVSLSSEKRRWETPTLDVTRFAPEDVITTSGGADQADVYDFDRDDWFRN